MDNILASIKKDYQSITKFPSSIFQDVEIAKIIVVISPHLLDYMPMTIKDDENVVKKSVLKYGFTIKYASRRLRANRDLVMISCQNNLSNIIYADKCLRDDFDFMKIFVEMDGTILAHVSLRLKNNKKFVMIAVNQTPVALTYAEELKDDPNFVLPIIEKDCSAVDFISNRLKRDRKFIF